MNEEGAVDIHNEYSDSQEVGYFANSENSWKI